MGISAKELNGLFKKSDYEEGDEIFRRLRIVGMLNTIEKTWTNKNIGEKNEKYWTTFYSKLFNVFQTIPVEVDSGQKSKEKWENPNTAFNNMVEFIQVASIYYTTLYNGLFADERWINDPSAIKFRGMLNAIKQMPEEQQVIIGQKMEELDSITKTGVYSPDGNSYNSTARVLSNALIEHTN